MQWGKEILKSPNLAIARFILILFTIISFILGQTWLLFTFLTGTIILIIHHFYFLVAGKGLYLENEKSLTRMTVGDNGEWVLSFINRGYPIINGTLTISFDESTEPSIQPFKKKGKSIEMLLPFKAWTNERVEISIPFIAAKRGISRVYNLELKIQHLFGSGTVLLDFQDYIKQKKLVYPKSKVVQYVKESQIFRHGFQDAKSSLFSDPLQPIGTREYVSGDSFGHIHWKATARMQQLQTKVFPHTGAQRWLLVLNVSDEHMLNSDLENLISYCAFLIEYAVKENIPFALAINARTHSKCPYFYLSEGEGRIQRQKAFEMLAMPFYPFAYPHHLLLKNIEQDISSFPIVIHLGQLNPLVNNILTNYQAKNSTIFEVETVNGQGVMGKWTRHHIAKHG